jgi:hypothetical protein
VLDDHESKKCKHNALLPAFGSTLQAPSRTLRLFQVSPIQHPFVVFPIVGATTATLLEVWSRFVHGRARARGTIAHTVLLRMREFGNRARRRCITLHTRNTHVIPATGWRAAMDRLRSLPPNAPMPRPKCRVERGENDAALAQEQREPTGKIEAPRDEAVESPHLTLWNSFLRIHIPDLAVC